MRDQQREASSLERRCQRVTVLELHSRRSSSLQFNGLREKVLWIRRERHLQDRNRKLFGSDVRNQWRRTLQPELQNRRLKFRYGKLWSRTKAAANVINPYGRNQPHPLRSQVLSEVRRPIWSCPQDQCSLCRALGYDLQSGES